MTTIFNSTDSEFAVATGTNVVTDGSLSEFDTGAAQSSSGLTITSNAGDAAPYKFDVGDTYDLNLTINGNAVTLEDAVVLRSDVMSVANGDSADATVLVFQGSDSDGNVAQVVWSPGFDVDDWVQNVVDNGGTPRFFTTDKDANTTYQAVCFAADTRVATAWGMRAVGGLNPGDLVETLDAGLQPLLWLGRQVVPGWGRHCPVRFSPGAIGNERPLRLSPQHRILHKSAKAEMLFGAPEVLLPAKAMIDGVKVCHAPVSRVTYVHLMFETHQIVTAEGAYCESLFLGDVAQEVLGQQALNTLAALFGGDLADAPQMEAARILLRYREAVLLTGGGGNARPEKPESADIFNLAA